MGFLKDSIYQIHSKGIGLPSIILEASCPRCHSVWQNPKPKHLQSELLFLWRYVYTLSWDSTLPSETIGINVVKIHPEQLQKKYAKENFRGMWKKDCPLFHTDMGWMEFVELDCSKDRCSSSHQNAHPFLSKVIFPHGQTRISWKTAEDIAYMMTMLIHKHPLGLTEMTHDWDLWWYAVLGQTLSSWTKF